MAFVLQMIKEIAKFCLYLFLVGNCLNNSVHHSNNRHIYSLLLYVNHEINSLIIIMLSILITSYKRECSIPFFFISIVEKIIHLFLKKKFKKNI